MTRWPLPDPMEAALAQAQLAAQDARIARLEAQIDALLARP